MVLQIKPLSDMIGKEIPFPEFATSGSAGMDIRACVREPVEIAPHSIVSVPAGFAIALPSADYVALVCARSGLAIRSGIALANGVGVIDSDYRGELCVGLINQSDAAYTVRTGERIAQLVVMPVCRPSLEICSDLDDTERGQGGFGSTGKL